MCSNLTIDVALAFPNYSHGRLYHVQVWQEILFDTYNNVCNLSMFTTYIKCNVHSGNNTYIHIT